MSDYTKRRSNRNGKQAEQRFKELAKKQGWTIEKSTYAQDRFEHWDFLVYDIKIDVKSRNDLSDDTYCWVELQAVDGRTGWLYGEADAFAFETLECFIICPKAALQLLMRCHLEDETIHHKRPDGFYKIYQRAGREDKVVRVPTQHILFISNIYIK